MFLNKSLLLLGLPCYQIFSLSHYIYIYIYMRERETRTHKIDKGNIRMIDRHGQYMIDESRVQVLDNNNIKDMNKLR